MRIRRTGVGVGAREFRLKRSRVAKQIKLRRHVAAVPVHEEMSWLNAEASPRNINAISVTCAVFQFPMSWLNGSGIKHSIHKSYLRCVPPPMSWLNAEQPRNICPISVTFPVFQLPMSWLNAEAIRNIDFISSHLRCVPTPNVLVERRSGIKHPIHINHFSCIPTPNVLVERRSGMKHPLHINHFSCIPTPNVLVERRTTTKHMSHISHLPGFPLRNVAVEGGELITKALILLLH